MSDAVIDRFAARFRLPADPAAAAERRAAVEGPLSTLIDEHLDAALARLDTGSEIVLVRRLAAPIRLGRGVTSWQAGVLWGEAIAAALERRLREPAAGEILRFARRLDALVAFVEAALAEEPGRDWAWRQLGFLSPASTPASATDRKLAIPSALTGEPELLAPALRRLASRGCLPELAQALEAEPIDGLVAAAAAAIGIALERGEAEPGLAWIPEEDSLPAAASTRAGQAFAQAIRLAAGASASWARLAALVLEAHRLMIGRVELETLAAKWLAFAQASPSPRTEPRRRSPARDDGRAAAAPPEARDIGAAPAGGVHADAPPRGMPDPEPGPERRPSRASRAAAADTDGSRRPGPSPAWTAFGGLMLLAPTVVESGAADALFDVDEEEVLRGRLHALALRLHEGLTPNDPAVLAFAGLRQFDEPPPEAAEPLIVQAAADAIAAHLAERLPEWAGPGLVARVVERPATILAEPGWIEVRFDLADVSPEIRRAGLDLDPGYLPWLGLVLKYRYD
jgi:hypothetical protein